MTAKTPNDRAQRQGYRHQSTPFGMGIPDETGEGTTLVLGGTGKTGRRVAERLVARGLPVRIGSRSGEPPFDWEDRATWAPALRGMASAYIAYQPDLAVPGAVDAVRAFTG